MAGRKAIAVSVLCLGLSVIRFASAEVVMDGTVGPAGALPGPFYDIGADLGRRAGGNLFHSFSRFSLSSAEAARFSGPDSVQHIVGRVTGGELSSIDGTVMSDIPGADLWLINPAGVLFGPNASLEVDGSVRIGTADYVGLADGGRFHATNPGASTLSIAPPESFGFLYGPNAPLTVANASLRLNPGERLSLVGGELHIDQRSELPGQLVVEGGRIDLVSLDGAGDVTLTGGAPVVSDNATGGTIRLTSNNTDSSYLITVDGERGGDLFIHAGELAIDGAVLSSSTLGGEDGGEILIHAEHIELTRGGVVAAITYGAGAGSRIRIEADTFSVDGADSDGNLSAVLSNAIADGRGGDIQLQVDRLIVDGGGFVDANTYGAADSGSIRIEASESIQIRGRGGDGSYSSISADTYSAGRGGDIFISAPRITIDDGSVYAEALTKGLPADASGDAGNIQIISERVEVIGEGVISTSNYGHGRGGNIQIDASESLVIRGRLIETDYLFSGVVADTDGPGRAGDIQVETGLLEIGYGELRSDSGIASNAPASAMGNAGNVTVRADRIELSEGGAISSTTFARGDGGTLDLRAENFIVIRGGRGNSGIYANNQGSTGRGGDIRLATERLELDDGVISAMSYVEGDAGSVTIKAEQMTLRDGVVASSAYSGGDGGAIDLRVAGQLLLDGETATVESLSGGAGSGGSVDIRAGSLRMENASQITTAGEAAGPAGSIDIQVSGDMRMNGESKILTRAVSRGGNIRIEAGELVYLRDSRISASAEGESRADDGGNLSLAGSGSVVLENGELLASANGGDGGNIRVSSQVFIADPDSRLDASSQFGVSGQVLVDAPESELSGQLRIQRLALNDTPRLLNDPCRRRRFGEQGSSLVVVPSQPRFRIENGRLIERKRDLSGCRKGSE